MFERLEFADVTVYLVAILGLLVVWPGFLTISGCKGQVFTTLRGVSATDSL
jgi:hypothetical protein